jgi:DNA polymerase-3 subunit alpha
MNNSNFCHLHVHNEFSYLDGYGSAEQYVTRAKEMGFKYLALTNHGNADGCLKFQQECDKQGIAPVLGAELYVVPNARDKSDRREKRGHMTVLVKGETGWQNLLKCITYSYLDGFYYKPRVDFDTILACDLSEWVVMSGCMGSFLRIEGVDSFLHELEDKLEDRLYYEIMPHNHEKQIEYNIRFVQTVSQLVATQDCHYVDKGDEKVQQMLLKIQSSEKWTDPRWFDFEELYLKSADEMMDAFDRQGQFSRRQYTPAMRNTIKIAKMCSDFRIPEKKVSLPLPDIELVVSEEQTLYDLCDKTRVPLDETGDWLPEYWDRFQREIHLIEQKKFVRYFLIVYDLIQWCHKNYIMASGY